MSLLKRLIVVVGLLGAGLLSSDAKAGLVVTNSGVTTPVGGILAVPTGGFADSARPGYFGFIDFTLDASDPVPIGFVFDYSLVDLKPDGSWDVLYSSSVGGSGPGIRIEPGGTSRVTLGGGINGAIANAILEPGQTELRLKFLVTELRLMSDPANPTPEPSSIALACTTLPIGLGLAWRRRKTRAV